MSSLRVPLYVAGVVLSFVALAGLVIYLSRSSVLTPEIGARMLGALTGLYVGFGILVLIFRLVLKLK